MRPASREQLFGQSIQVRKDAFHTMTIRTPLTLPFLSIYSLHAAIAQPLVNHTHNRDEFFESIRHYQSAVNTIQSNRLRLSNSTVYSYDDETYSDTEDSFLHDGSGSGHLENPDDDEESIIEGSTTGVSETTPVYPSSTTSGWGFETTSSTQIPIMVVPIGAGGSSASSLHLSTTLMLSLSVLWVHSLRHCVW